MSLMWWNIVKLLKSKLIVLFALSCFLSCSLIQKNEFAKYEPPKDKILVFAGQDNESVGGNDRFNNGYVDCVDIPAGITHYIGLGPASGTDGKIPGLNIESTWGAGPMCLKYYLDSPKLKNCIIHLSISMVDHEKEVAQGLFDKQIMEIDDFLKEYKDRPFFLRIGYEFDGEWNHYDSTYYKKAFRRIVDILKGQNVSNFATIFASTSPVVNYKLWSAYYPGDEYVDWCGYSYWGKCPEECSSIQFARDHKKPIFVAETAPRGYYFLKEDGKAVWDEWFAPFFQHIENNGDIIKAFSYINCNWDAQPMWDGWGDTRIQVVNYLKKKWLEKMSDPRYVNGNDDVFSLIRFEGK